MAYGNKSKTETFVLTLPLVTHLHDEAYLEDTFNRYWHAYNWLVAKTLNEWHQVRKLRLYKQLTDKIRASKKDSKERKEFYVERKALLE